MTTPGYLAVGGVEVSNNQRTAAYLAAGLDTPQFEITSRVGCEALTAMAFPQGSCEGVTYAWQRDGSNPIGDWRSPDDGLALTPLSSQVGSFPYVGTLLDDFDTDGTPAPGWTGNMLGAGMTVMQALGGLFRNSVGNTNGAIWTTTYAPDMEASIELAPGWNADNFELWARARNLTVAGSAEGYLIFYDAGANSLILQRYGPGSGTGYVTMATLACTLEVGNVVGIRVVGSGTSSPGVVIQAWVARSTSDPFQLVLSARHTAGAFTLGNQIAFVSYSPNARYDNLRGGVINGSQLWTLDPSGVVGPSAAMVPSPSRGGIVLPNPGTTDATLLVGFGEVVLRSSTGTQLAAFGRLVNVGGGANVGCVGVGLETSGGGLNVVVTRRLPGGTITTASLALAVGPTPPANNFPTNGQALYGQWIFTSTGITFKLYGAPPGLMYASDPGFGTNGQEAPLIGSWTYGYDATPNALWPGGSEAAAMATATEVGSLLGVTSASFHTVGNMPIHMIQLGPTLPPHYSNACGLTWPSPAQFPSPAMNPSTYGAFVNPDNDEAPWIDLDQLEESSGFYGMLLTDIKGLDSTEKRSLDPSASGIGGILGPIQLEPRVLEFTGYLIANGAPAMNYARRWLAQTIGGALCPGCGGNFVDVLPTCGAADLTQFEGGVAVLPADARRLYDGGLTAIEVDTSDAISCDYVLPISFSISFADPYLYTLPETQAIGDTGDGSFAYLSAASTDSPAIPFEDWLFDQNPPDAICVELDAPTVGIDAAIVTVSGNGRPLSGVLVYSSQGTYPYAGLFPGACVFPADGTPLWDITTCPFVFDVVDLGADESFTVDSSRRRLVRTLASGQEINGADALALAPGQVIQWIDTCAGGPIQACVQAYSNCTCNEAATVTIATQHRER